MLRTIYSNTKLNFFLKFSVYSTSKSFGATINFFLLFHAYYHYGSCMPSLSLLTVLQGVLISGCPEGRGQKTEWLAPTQYWGALNRVEWILLTEWTAPI